VWAAEPAERPTPAESAEDDDDDDNNNNNNNNEMLAKTVVN
jgi:hypothetical protein